MLTQPVTKSGRNCNAFSTTPRGNPINVPHMMIKWTAERIFIAILAFLAFAGTAAAHGQSELTTSVGRAADDADIDIIRLAYRRTLAGDVRWWMPTLVEFGGGIWRVPDLAGATQRFDLHATPVWRADFSHTYVEAGIGVYLLSHTINNNTTSLSTSLEFGSHAGAGLRLGTRGETRVGIALQHLSNGGIKQPSGGVTFMLVTASFLL